MTDRILGPAGVLPPAEWAVGARVVIPLAQEAVVVSADYLEDEWLSMAYKDGASVYGENAPIAGLRLDLTTGPLDHGTRALLTLVAPEVEQPLTAPSWIPTDRGWSLRWGLEHDGTCLTTHTKDFVQARVYDRDIAAPEAVREPDPRRALALALHAAAEVSRG